VSKEDLIKNFHQAEDELQFAIASGDQERIKTATRARAKAWREYTQFKKKEFKK
jgi:hypothetical protein